MSAATKGTPVSISPEMKTVPRDSGHGLKLLTDLGVGEQRE
jgi:hypothetical protein